MTRRLRTQSRPTASHRSRKPLVELLDKRELLTASPIAFPMYDLSALASNATPPAGAYTPVQIGNAYGFNKITFGSAAGTGAGETIAIVDAYDDPNIQADLNTFDTQFGLASTTITRTSETGSSTLPSTDSTGGWELEEALDVEWAHAMAPGAKIILIEASTASESDLMAGVKYAATVANVVSMSWGGGEFAGQTGASYDGVFNHAGVAFVASSGDTGAPIAWPASSQNVLAVGGTSLTLTSSGTYSSESGWSGSGGGASAYESQPAYQSGVVTQTTTKRANPDVAYDASPSTGFAVYDSFTYNNKSYGWVELGGTSAGAPQWAAMIAIGDQGRALSGQPAIDATSPQEVMTTLYKSANSADFHDVTTGSSTGSTSYAAGTGYDYVTGLGSPMANLVIKSLDPAATAAPTDHLVVSSPTSATAGTSFTITVTADTSANAADHTYTGTVTFSSTDTQAGLPSSYTFTSADAGSHTFTITLKTAGSKTVTANDAAHSITVTTGAITVTAAPAPAPTGLTAASVTASEVDLSWTGVSGSSGYTIQRSDNGSTGWTQIGTTASGVTTFKDTGVVSGANYFYRVSATVSGSTSSFSSVATASTKAAAAATSSIWGNGVTPSEDSYSSGSYELGLKFESSTAGTISGARFYKQSWMGGNTHVGHLWSSNGTLLATATFSGETASGWQQVLFSKPVAIAANTIYIVSFSSGGGKFGLTSNYFNNGGVTSGPLQALAGSTPGGNSVYGQSGSFPTTNGSGKNFWVDVVFTASATTSAHASTAMTTSTTTTPAGKSAGSTEHAKSVPSKSTTLVHGHAWHRNVTTPALHSATSPSRKGSLFGRHG